MNSIGSFSERPRLYYNIDGVGELGIGFMCLSYALLAWLQMHTPATSVWHQTYTFIVYVAVMLSIIHYGSKAIKERITYPRTGYVEYRKRNRIWAGVAGFVVAASLSIGLMIAARRRWEISIPGSLIGLLFAASYFRFAMAVRWKWQVFAILVAGSLAIAALPPGLAEAFANHSSFTSAIPARVVGAFWLTFVVYGVVSMLSGGISFWLYLRHTQALADTQ
jgi:hypothetical protein